MTKEQAKKVIEMLTEDKPLSKEDVIKVIDMIDEPSVQYIPIQTTPTINEPWNPYPKFFCTTSDGIRYCTTDKEVTA